MRSPLRTTSWSSASTMVISLSDSATASGLCDTAGLRTHVLSRSDPSGHPGCVRRAMRRCFPRHMTDWLIALGCIFGVNLLPAFGPPTWALLVFFRLNSDLAAVPLVLFGALAAAG